MSRIISTTKKHKRTKTKAVQVLPRETPAQRLPSEVPVHRLPRETPVQSLPRETPAQSLPHETPVTDNPLLIAYRNKNAVPMRLVPATVARSWIDATDRQFAKRCLPML